MVEMSVTEYRDSINKSSWHKERWMDVAREFISHKFHDADMFDDKQLNSFGKLYLVELDGGNNYQRISTDMKRIYKTHGIHGEVCLFYYTGWLRTNDIIIKREYWRDYSYIPKDFAPDVSKEDKKWLEEKTTENKTYQCEEPAIKFYQTGVWEPNFQRRFAKELGILVRRKCLLVFSENGEAWIREVMKKRGISIIDPPPWREMIAVRMARYSRKFSTSKTETPPTVSEPLTPVE